MPKNSVDLDLAYSAEFLIHEEDLIDRTDFSKGTQNTGYLRCAILLVAAALVWLMGCEPPSRELPDVPPCVASPELCDGMDTVGT